MTFIYFKILVQCPPEPYLAPPVMLMCYLNKESPSTEITNQQLKPFVNGIILKGW